MIPVGAVGGGPMTDATSALRDDPAPEVDVQEPVTPAAPRSRRATPGRSEHAALWASIVVAVVVPLLAALEAQLPGQVLLVLLYALAVPGVPLASLLGLRNRLVAASMAGAL